MPGMLVRHRTCRCCPGPERGVARRREERDWRRTLQETSMWANAAVAIHEDK